MFVIACYYIVTLAWNSIESLHFIPRPSCKLWSWHITKESARARKDSLKPHYHGAYISKALTMAPQPLALQPPSASPKKVNFTAWYKQQSHTKIDELEEFWKLPQQDFQNCDFVQQWTTWGAQFGSLSQFACDIFTIPGELAIVLSSNILSPVLKGLLLLSNESSQVCVIQFPYTMQVWSPRPLGH